MQFLTLTFQVFNSHLWAVQIYSVFIITESFDEHRRLDKPQTQSLLLGKPSL